MATSSLILNLGEYDFQLAEISYGNNMFDIQSLGFESSDTPLLDTSSEQAMQIHAKQIEDLMSKLQIKKRNVNIIIPDSLSYTQILQMPKLKEKELLSAIKYQADQFIPMPLEQAALDLEILYEDKEKRSLLVLIVATAQSTIKKIEDIVEMAGLLPESVENELSATSRAVSELYKSKLPKSGSVFVNFGLTSTSLYFYSQQYGLIVDTHSFKFGKNLFIRDIQTNTTFDKKKCEDILKRIGFGQDGAINFDDLLRPVFTEWVKEIEKFTLAVKEKYAIETIEGVYLLNHAHEVNGIEKKLQTALSLPVPQFDISAHLKKTPLTESIGHDLSSCVTLLGGSLR